MVENENEKGTPWDEGEQKERRDLFALYSPEFLVKEGLGSWTARRLGMDRESGSTLELIIEIGLRDEDEALGAAVAARLRRLLPAIVKEAVTLAHDVVYPGDQQGEQA